MKPKRRYKAYNQYDFAELLQVSQPMISLLLSGEEKISWPLGARLSKLFPGKDIEGWRAAGSKGLKLVYAQKKLEAELNSKKEVA